MSIPAEIEEISTGTVNCFVLMEHGVIVGVDSRSTSTRLDKETNKEYRVLKNEEAEKMKVIGPGVVLTTCGNVGRKLALWKYLEEMEKPNDVMEAVLLIESFLESNPTTDKSCSMFVIGYCDIYDKFIAFRLGDKIEEKQSYSDINDPFHAIGSGSGIAKLAWRRQYASKTKRMGDDRDSVAMAVKEVLVSACMDDPCCGGLIRLCWVGKRTVDPIGTDEHLIDAMLSTQMPLKKTNILMFADVSHDNINYNTIMKHFQNDYNCELKRKPQCLGYVVHEKWTCFLVDVVTKDKENKSDDYFRKFCQRMRGYDPDYIRLTYIRGVKDSRKKVPVLVARGDLEILREAREGELFA